MTMTDTVSPLQRTLDAKNADLEEMLSALLPEVTEAEGELFDAMRYATLGGGKRLRPFLTLTTADIFHVNTTSALRVAAAVEMIHCYSLIHDDLPSLDNGSLRRGKPTCHRQFGEAMAVLAGDALLSRAFDVLSAPETHADPAVRCTLVRDLAHPGPMAWLADKPLTSWPSVPLMHKAVSTWPAVTRMHYMKTGQLIGFSCTAGAILGKAAPQIKHALQAYAHDLGLAFQIVDDLLDVDGHPNRTGKNQGKDVANGRVTFVTLLGAARAREQAYMLGEQAVSHLKIFDSEADLLREVVSYVLERSS